jgi:hypothetical protein
MDSVESLLSTSFLFLVMHPSLKTKNKTSA